jgi:hypothetical protein
LVLACAKSDRVKAVDESAKGCDGIAARWKKALAAGSSACTTDADCDCFNGGVDAAKGCGGVSDRATAASLEKVRDEFVKAQCTEAVQCAAWVCKPRCLEGRCG